MISQKNVSAEFFRCALCGKNRKTNSRKIDNPALLIYEKELTGGFMPDYIT